jgi:uncharacterized protein
MTGVILPVCCIGALPIALTLNRKGASLGPVLAFLVATPATSVPALIVSWKLLGIVFTFAIFFSAVLIGLIMGFGIEAMKISSKILPAEQGYCCDDPQAKEKDAFSRKLVGAVQYAFVTLPKEIGVEILIGIGLASFITVFEPLQYFIRQYLTEALGYFFVLMIGLLTYVCSTASIPLADAFIQSGMSKGQALCYLLVGPITSYSTILVLKKDFGLFILTIYLIIIGASSLFFGMAFDAFIK